MQRGENTARKEGSTTIRRKEKEIYKAMYAINCKEHLEQGDQDVKMPLKKCVKSIEFVTRYSTSFAC